MFRTIEQLVGMSDVVTDPIPTSNPRVLPLLNDNLVVGIEVPMVCISTLLKPWVRICALVDGLL
jgi:hypothetical protein